jgi:hypothetical protein
MKGRDGGGRTWIVVSQVPKYEGTFDKLGQARGKYVCG